MQQFFSFQTLPFHFLFQLKHTPVIFKDIHLEDQGSSKNGFEDRSIQTISWCRYGISFPFEQHHPDMNVTRGLRQPHKRMARVVRLHLAREKFVDFPPDVLPEKDAPPPDSQGTLPWPDKDQMSRFNSRLSVETKLRMRLDGDEIDSEHPPV